MSLHPLPPEVKPHRFMDILDILYWDGIYNARIKVCHWRVLEHTDSKEIDGYRWISYVFGLGNQDHSRSFPSSKYISVGSMEPPFEELPSFFFFFFLFCHFLEAQNYYQQSCMVHKGRRKKPVCTQQRTPHLLVNDVRRVAILLTKHRLLPVTRYSTTVPLIYFLCERTRTR